MMTDHDTNHRGETLLIRYGTGDAQNEVPNAYHNMIANRLNRVAGLTSPRRFSNASAAGFSTQGIVKGESITWRVHEQLPNASERAPTVGPRYGGLYVPDR